MHSGDWRRLVAAAAVGCALAASGCSREKSEDVQPVVTVDVAPVLTTTIQGKVRGDALLFPTQQAAIVSKMSGPVKKFYVNRGDRVRAGQLLAELANADLLAAVTESQAAFNQAEAAYQTAIKATLPEEAQKAELDMQAAKEVMDAQQAVLTSRQDLFKQGAIAQKDVNDAQVAFVQARNQYQTTQRHLENLRGFASAQEIKGAEAQRDAAKGRLENAQAQLSYSRIVSPIDGVVTERPLYAGETAASGTPLVTVMDISRVIARTHVPPSEASQLKVGGDANLLVPNKAGVPGKITQISPALDTGGTTVEVWTEVPNADGLLKPGTSLQVEMIAQTVADALVIPQSAVLTSASGATSVIVIDADNKPHKESVTLGVRDAGNVQVTDGLSSGQRVVTVGAFGLGKLDADILEKTKVQIQPPKEEEEDK
jgi:multidrug efflux pump subunit AcrA (membrane-fusion protein)